MHRDLASAEEMTALGDQVAELRSHLELITSPAPDLRLRMRGLLDTHRLFGGRSEALDDLDAFVDTPGAQHLLVIGGAGPLIGEGRFRNPA